MGRRPLKASPAGRCAPQSASRPAAQSEVPDRQPEVTLSFPRWGPGGNGSAAAPEDPEPTPGSSVPQRWEGHPGLEKEGARDGG